MIDYKNIQALAKIIEAGSFSAAAHTLKISQSAISQRIKELEDSVGQSVIIRSKPLKLNQTGEKLIAHYNQVANLQQDLLEILHPPEHQGFQSVKIALNNDSLEYWFMSKLAPFLKTEKILLDILTADENKSADLLIKGQAYLAISSQASIGHNFLSQKLGQFHYRCVMSREFAKKYFSKGINKKSLLNAPYIFYDQDDYLSYHFLEKQFRLKRDEIKLAYFIPSPRQIEEAVNLGLGYALIPEICCKNHDFTELKKGLNASQTYYLHSWYELPEHLKKLKKEIIKICATSLK